MRANLQLSLPLDRRELCRYLVCPMREMDRLEGEIAKAEQELMERAAPRCTFARFPLIRGEGDALAFGPQIPLEGGDIRCHLAGCGAVILMAVTLGAGVDELLRRAAAQDLARSVLLDAAASVAAEQAAALAEGRAAESLCRAGEYHTGRFSPGYGDLPIELQRRVVLLLDAPRRIGLAVTNSLILTPRKSVTALIGVSDHPVAGRLAGCDSCRLREKCEGRKRGMPCGGEKSE